MTPRPPRPTALPLSVGSIPAELKAWSHWVCWAYEYQPERTPAKPWAKVPKSPATGDNASTTNPETWSTFAQALACYQGQGFAGIGFVLSAEDPYVAVDLDGCRDPDSGDIEPWAQAIIDRLHSYTEVSPSGAGIRILARGTLPSGGRKKGVIEVYDRARYVTTTGCHLEDSPPSIEDCTPALMAWHAEVFGQPRTSQSSPQGRDAPSTLSDGAILEKAGQAANAEHFRRLWDGNTSGYPSQSEADLALCCLLAFWTRDLAQLDRLFRHSRLYRDKWDEPHGDATYGNRTMARALQTVITHYHPNGQPTEAGEIHLTDLGNAERLVRRYGRELHYVHAWGKWLSWDGQRWHLDECGGVDTRAALLVLDLFHSASAQVKEIEDVLGGAHHAE
jgi:putative DNA primase/helicase